jgi:hypothetical protein
MATLDGQAGTLYADLTVFTLGAELRWTPGVGLARLFERTSPYVAARAGLTVILHTSQQLFTGSGLLLAQPDNNAHLAPFAGAGIGVAHRLGDHFFLSGEVAVSVTDNQRVFAAIAEAAWAWY